MSENTDSNIIFMGTPEFAVPTMLAMHENFGLKAVITTPDKKKGRGRKAQPSPVKSAALELGTPILQPESVKDEGFLEEFKALKPDILCIVAFRILPPEVFEAPSICSFNIHASLLPKYRGAAPINWAIINGEKKSGLTSFILAKKVDTGGILLQKPIPIDENSTAGDYGAKLMPEAAKLAVETTRALLSGDYKTMAQDDSQATPAPKLFRENCKINWDGHASDVGRFILGTSPTPGAWTIWNGKKLKILRCRFSACGRGEPGEYIIDKSNFTVQCRKGVVALTEIQPENKKPMKTEDFLRGYRGDTQGFFDK